MKQSRSGIWRAYVLIAVHVLMLAHFIHWLYAGSTLTPVEPSESAEFFRRGEINMGLIFFGVAILATLIFGRFVCGWGCHLIAYQDLMLWVLKKLHIRPKAFRTRFLILIPLVIAAGWMFILPIVVRIWAEFYREDIVPPSTWHLARTGYWDTFPSLPWGIASVFFAGFAIIYFLGPKGFCTFACPYGAFFGLADKLALWRVRVNDNCEQCGHCTAVCTSNVNVAEEVNRYGMVVNPGCMKCMDCVQVCPNDALSISIGKPAILATASRAAKERKYDLTLRMEIVALITFVFVLMTVNGLYSQFPFLMSLAIAGIAAFLFMKWLALWGSRDVLLQKIRLKVGGRLRPAGWIFSAMALLMSVAVAHSAVWRYHTIRGEHPDLNVADMLMNRGFQKYAPPEYPDWQYDSTYVGEMDADQTAKVDLGIQQFEAANAWGVFGTVANHYRLAWLYHCKNRRADAVEQMRRAAALAGDLPVFWNELAKFEVAAGNDVEARAAFEKAIALETVEREALTRKTGISKHPLAAEIWLDWGLFQGFRLNDFNAGNAALEKAAQFDDSVLLARAKAMTHQGQMPVAAALLKAYLTATDDDVVRFDYGAMLFVNGDLAGAASAFETVLEHDPYHAQAAFRLGVTYLRTGRTNDAMKVFAITRKHGTDAEIAELDALLSELEIMAAP